MSDFKSRSDYFKEIAHQSKVIAHQRPTAPGNDQMRKSFFRINDEEELKSACANWIYFPCVAHESFDITYTQPITGMPHEIIGNYLFFLAKMDTTNYPLIPDAIEAAKDQAFDAMNKFISYLIEDHAENGCCGNLFLFNMNRAKATEVGPYNSNLYGWYLTFFDEEKAKGTIYNANDWYNDDIETEEGQDILTEDGQTISTE